MKTLSRFLFTAFLGTVILSSCSRPVAYFQPSSREHLATSPAQITPAATAQTLPANQQFIQVQTTLEQVDALVSTDSKLATTKTVQKRLNRVRTLLTAASAKASLTPTGPTTPRKMSLMKRLVLQKMDKKISRQLAPANPDKALMNSGTLATGAVLVIVGLLLILLTSGTAFTIGIIALLAGAVLLLVGLL